MMNQICNFFKMYALTCAASIIIGYLLGSINFAIVLTKNKKDIRQLGSQNAGFTNVMRSVGTNLAIITLCGDMLKCAVAILISWGMFYIHGGDIPFGLLRSYAALIAGGACVVGHVFPCFFKFRGGKGISTVSMVILMSDFRVFFIVLSIYAIVFFCFKIVSLASITACAVYPVVHFVVTYFFVYRVHSSCHEFYYLVFSTSMTFLISLLIILKHKSNIKRLLSGQEKKIKAAKK